MFLSRNGKWLVAGIVAVAFVGYLFFEAIADGVRTIAGGGRALDFVAAHWGLWLAGVVVGAVIAVVSMAVGAADLLRGGRGGGDPRSAVSGFKFGIGVAVVSAIPLAVAIVTALS